MKEDMLVVKSIREIVNVCLTPMKMNAHNPCDTGEESEAQKSIVTCPLMGLESSFSDSYYVTQYTQLSLYFCRDFNIVYHLMRLSVDYDGN